MTPSPLAELEFAEEEPVPDGAAAELADVGTPTVAADDSSEDTDAGVETDATGAAEDALVIMVVAAEVIGVMGVALRSAVKVESSAELATLLAAKSLLEVAMAEVVTPPDAVPAPDPPPSA